MGQPRKINSVLAQRMRAIEEELHDVRHVAKKLERGIQTAERAPFFLTRHPTESTDGNMKAAGTPQDAASTPLPVTGIDGGSKDRMQGSAAAISPRTTPPVSNNEKFASYFMVGSLHGVPPLGKEIKKARNRAVFLSVVAFFVLVWLIWFLYT